MKEALEKLVHSIHEYFSNLTKKEKIRFALLATLVIGLAIVATVLLSRVNYVPVYTGLDAAMAGKFRVAIEELGYTVKTQGTGTLLVPEGTEDEIRQRLAASGVEGVVGFDYTLYDSASNFGTTDKVANAALLYQKAEHLQTMINTNVKIKSSLVMIVQPETSGFIKTANDVESSVSVHLTLENGESLSNAEARNIAMMVLNGIPGLSLDRISIIDQYLVRYTLDEAEVYDTGDDIARRIQMERQTAVQYEATVSRMLLAILQDEENFQVGANVQMTMDDEIVESRIYEPPVPGANQGLAVSLKRVYEGINEDGNVIGIPGTDENGLNTVTYPELGLEDDEAYYKFSEEINYEINEIYTRTAKEKGRIIDASFGVVYNSDFLSAEYIPDIQNMVAMAVGIDINKVSVQSIPFNLPQAEIGPEPERMDSSDIRDIIKTLINALVVLLLALALFALIRMIYKSSQPRPQTVLADGTGMNIDYIADDDYIDITGLNETEESDLEDEEEELTIQEVEEEFVPEFAIKQKDEGIDKLEIFIDRDAESVAALLRNWLTED